MNLRRPSDRKRSQRLIDLDDSLLVKAPKRARISSSDGTHLKTRAAATSPTTTPTRPKNVSGPEKATTPVTNARVSGKAGSDRRRADSPVSEAASGQSADEVYDDLKCETCGSPDCDEDNDILICDGCEKGFHQACAGVSTIPRGDWFCADCDEIRRAKSDRTGSKPSGRGRPRAAVAKDDADEEDVVTVTAAPEGVLSPGDIPNFETHLAALQRVLIDRCNGLHEARCDRGWWQKPLNDIVRLAEQTIVGGEGNSMALIGPRGSGKTALMRAMQRRLSQLHPDKYHLVELDGFVCLDDKQAIREIWRQLGREMDADEDIINKPTTLADMMQTLLATLSHPSEMGIDGDNVTSKAVIFIINEANFFAEHHRQTLLYNLFDIAQSRKAPIFVICVTTRIDFASDLEKRVRSRFGHRFTWVRPAANLDEYTEQCRDSLVIDKNDLADEGINTNLEGFDEFHKFWDHKVDTLFKTKAFQALLRQHFWENRTLPPFLLSCRMMLLNMQHEGSDLTLQPPTLDETTASSRGRKSFAASIAATSTDKQALADAHGPDSKLSLLPSLSDLGLSLLVAAARLEPFAGAELVNLGMAYDEYASLVSRQRTQSVATTGGMSSPLVAAGAAARLWSKRRAAAEWEHLVNLGLLIPAGPSGGASIRRGPRATGAQGAAGLDAKMFRVDLRLEEIPDAVVGIAAHLVKWCRAP